MSEWSEWRDPDDPKRGSDEHKLYRNRIGNLLLLESDINKEVGDYEFMLEDAYPGRAATIGGQPPLFYGDSVLKLPKKLVLNRTADICNPVTPRWAPTSLRRLLAWTWQGRLFPWWLVAPLRRPSPFSLRRRDWAGPALAVAVAVREHARGHSERWPSRAASSYDNSDIVSDANAVSSCWRSLGENVVRVRAWSRSTRPSWPARGTEPPSGTRCRRGDYSIGALRCTRACL